VTVRVLNVTKLAVTGYIDLSLADRPFLSRAGAPVLHHPMRTLATVMAESLLAALVLAAVPVGPAAAEPAGVPSQQDVTAARTLAALAADEVGRAQATLAAADSRMRQLADEAEAVVESYNAARVRLARATETSTAATAELAAADAAVAQAQRDTAAFVASTYRTGGDVARITALLSSGGPATYLQQVGALDVISHREAAALDLLANARIARHLAQQRALRTMTAEQDAAATAAVAKTRVEASVADQGRQLADLAGQRQQLEQQLAQAQVRADAVARSREDGLARLRAEAEAQAQARAQAQAQVPAQAPAATVVAQPGSGAAVAPGSASAARSVGAGVSPSAGTGGVRSGGSSSPTAQQGAVAVQYASAQLGKPYIWGAEGPGTFDCSGLTMRAWGQAGVSIDHWTGSQWVEGTRVGRDALRPGDLLFFATNTSNPDTIHHVAIYIGDGKMIHAPQTGDVVKISPIGRSDFIGAVRP